MKKIFIFSFFFCTVISVTARSQDSSCYSYFSYTKLFDQNIQFINSSSMPDSSNSAYFTWHFGDGDTSIASDPIHHYSVEGQYLACLYMTTKSGCSANFCDSVYVQDNSSLCRVSFNWYPESQNGFLFHSNVPFDSASVLSWSFGDGSSISHDINPYHSFASPGTYHVCLSFAGANCSTAYCSDLNVLPDSAFCNAGFSELQNGAVVYFYPFTDSLYNNGDSLSSYYWTFGDGDSSYLKNPAHVYARDGVYTVCLTLTHQSCSDTKCQSIYYTSNDSTGGGGSSCSALFSISDADSSTNTIWLDNLSSGAMSYFWSFGDSTFSNAEFPSHTYPGSGPYTVCLTITCDSGTSTYCSSVSLGDSMAHIALRRLILNVRPAKTTKVNPVVSPRLNVKIVPSPASDFIRIILPSSEKSFTALKVYNLYGMEVINRDINGFSQGSTRIDIRNLPAGQYIVELEGKSNVAVGRFVKY